MLNDYSILITYIAYEFSSIYTYDTSGYERISTLQAVYH